LNASLRILAFFFFYPEKLSASVSPNSYGYKLIFPKIIEAKKAALKSALPIWISDLHIYMPRRGIHCPWKSDISTISGNILRDNLR
jgi:hypothetical protein